MPSLAEIRFQALPEITRIEEDPFPIWRSSTQSICILQRVVTWGLDRFSRFFVLSVLALGLGSKLVEIRSGEFTKCGSLKSVTIPASVEVLGYMRFSSCKSLESRTFESILG
jgi:hypothetical protein